MDGAAEAVAAEIVPGGHWTHVVVYPKSQMNSISWFQGSEWTDGRMYRTELATNLGVKRAFCGGVLETPKGGKGYLLLLLLSRTKLVKHVS